MYVWSSTYRTTLKTLCSAQKRSVRTENFPLDKLNNQQEGIHAFKVINYTYLLNDFLNRGDVWHQIKVRNIGDLWIPLYTATQSQLFVRYRAINAWNGLSGDLRSSSSLSTVMNKLRQLYRSLT